MANIFDDAATFKDYHLKRLAPSTVTYNPVAGRSRSITVVARQADEPELEDAGDETFSERLFVLCDRDSTTGIDSPQLGDLITRSITDDADRRPFVFTGEKEDITQSSWVLIFGRHLHTGRSPTG